MKFPPISLTGPPRPTSRQCAYLSELQSRLGLSYREIAKRSGSIPGRPDLAFTHQAISKWFRGASVPSEKGRELLSLVFKVSQQEIDIGCGIVRRPPPDNTHGVLVHAIDLNGTLHSYPLKLAGGVDLTRPALLENWSSLFVGGSRGLTRHFKSLKGRLCGYTPVAVRPYINHPRSVVLVETRHKAFDKLESPTKHLWFVYLPDNTLEVAHLFAEPQGRRVLLARPGEKASKWRRFHRDEVDPVGHVGNRLLFSLAPIEEKILQKKDTSGTNIF